ncbi:MAG TPA: MFS transporter [Blastocatellia bacterium]|nr:MFS transporter [Blastocatellia bacterium]
MSIPVAESNQQLEQPTKQPGLGYAWYVVIVLMVCYTLSFIDRQILSLLVAPIKRDLGISDTKIGLLQGLAFAVFYTLLGFPLGRIADRYSRRNLIAVGVFFWSLMTALCSVALSFWSLATARMGVGVGEATLGPSAFSMISDYFPKERLGGALSVYAMGIFIGSGLALIVGGTVVGKVSELPAVDLPLIGTIASWRLTFLIVGLPGLLIGLLVYTVREPLRQNLMRQTDGRVSQLHLREVLAQLARRWRSVVGVSLGLSSQAMCNYAMLAWAPTYFLRVHGWKPRDTGLVLGVMTLTVGCVGMYFGGKLCDRWQQRRISEAPLKVGVIATTTVGVLFTLMTVLPNLTWILVLLTCSQFFLAMPVGSSYAALQFIFPNQLRGQVSALLLFTINIGGLMLGPLLPGLFNDYLFRDENLVGASLALTIIMASVTAATLFRTTYRPYRAHYAMMHEAS